MYGSLVKALDMASGDWVIVWVIGKGAGHGIRRQWVTVWVIGHGIRRLWVQILIEAVQK